MAVCCVALRPLLCVRGGKKCRGHSERVGGGAARRDATHCSEHTLRRAMLCRELGSAFGNNITDVCLKGKDGEQFLVVRSDNFDERIGQVRAADVAVVVPGGDGSPSSEGLHPITLAEYLQEAGKYGGYAGVPDGTSLYDGDRDGMVGIRFQAVFLPVGEDGKVEMYNQSFNYQTQSKEDPRNVILLCTTQGTFLQQDGPGQVPQYLHKRDGAGYECTYLEALRTRHGVSMEQKDTAEEAAAAAAAGKATSGVIGIRSMGMGFNRLMTVQVPLKQKAPLRFAVPDFLEDECEDSGCDFSTDMQFDVFSSVAAEQDECALPDGPEPAMMMRSGAAAAPPPSRAKAARVSHGSSAGPMPPAASDNWERDSDCSVTITVQFYFVVEKGTTVEPQDIRDAVDLCEAALKGCDADGKLMDGERWWMRQEMSAEDKARIADTLATAGVGSAGGAPVAAEGKAGDGVAVEGKAEEGGAGDAGDAAGASAGEGSAPDTEGKAGDAGDVSGEESVAGESGSGGKKGCVIM